MNDNPNFKLRWDLLALDGVGVVLFAFGMAKMFAGIDILPPTLQFDETGWSMIVLGIFLMLPFMLNVLAQVRARTEGKSFK